MEFIFQLQNSGSTNLSGQHLSKQKMELYTVVKVGDGIGQGPATDVTHFRLNQPQVFPVLWYHKCALISSNGVLTLPSCPQSNS